MITRRGREPPPAGEDPGYDQRQAPNVDRFIDRHGKPRHYYRRGKGACIRLPGEPGSTEFMLAYETAATSSGPCQTAASWQLKSDDFTAASANADSR